MYKIAFLDRDGTINIDKKYVYRIEDFQFLPGVISGLKTLQSHGFLLVVVTNQSGIARGMYTEEDLKELNLWLNHTLQGHGINLEGIYYCPHLPNAAVKQYRKVCDCRKPKTGLFKMALSDLKTKYGDIDFSKSVAIGDKMRDLSICDELDIDGVLIQNDVKEVETSVAQHKFFIANDFTSAVNWILVNEVDK